MHPVEAISHPSGARPDIAIFIGTDAIRAPCSHTFDLHLAKGFLPAKCFPIGNVPAIDALGGILSCVGNVELLVIWGKTQTVGFDQFIGDQAHGA